MNIISNAVRYNKEKGEILLSYYETQVDDRHILFEFHCKDTGVGMSKEFQNHIFEPFTQETGGARSVYGGTGLGMPITKKLIEKMGGTIKFESEKNVGTTFMVQLPFLISADMKQAESQEDDVSIEGMRILLAEDNELNMEIAEFLLTNAGAEITKASNGKEAVEAFEYIAKTEGIICAIESAHAVAHLMKLAPTMSKDDIIICCLSGRGDKDVAAIARYRGVDLHE